METKFFLKPLSLIAIIVFSFWLISKLNISLPLSIVSTVTNKADVFSVSGEGKVVVKPDTAQINLGITASGATIKDVQSKANQIMNKISSDLKKLGIKETDIQTTNYTLRPEYNYQVSPQKITGYVADINLQVKVKDLDKINQVIDTAAADGANLVGGLTFTVDNKEKYENEARKLAIEDAKKKAQTLASQAGLTLGRLINVTESLTPQPVPILRAVNLEKGIGVPSEPTQIEPGSTEIKIIVTLIYETH